jgi:hypothetical protein
MYFGIDALCKRKWYSIDWEKAEELGNTDAIIMKNK